MSTDYYLVCHKCNVSIHIAQDGFSGFTFYSGEPECMKALSGFFNDHARHPLQLMSEHDLQDVRLKYVEVEWIPVIYLRTKRARSPRE